MCLMPTSFHNFGTYTLQEISNCSIDYRVSPPNTVDLYRHVTLPCKGNRETPSNRNVEYRVLTGLGKAE